MPPPKAPLPPWSFSPPGGFLGPEKAPGLGLGHVIEQSVRIREQEAWERKRTAPPLSNDKNGNGPGDFASQRRPWLLKHARVVCRNESDAEDLVQEALLRFIQTFEKLESLPPVRVCEGWLVTTLTNLFYDQCRKRKVQADGAKDPTLSAEAAVTEDSSVESVYDAITDEQFAQGLHVLSPKIRATFEMHAAGKRYQDIAWELGVPVGTVAKRLHDARTKLRKFLQRFTQPEIH